MLQSNSQSLVVLCGASVLLGSLVFVYLDQSKIRRFGRILWDGDVESKRAFLELYNCKNLAEEKFGMLNGIHVDDDPEYTLRKLGYLEQEIENILFKVDAVRGDDLVIDKRRELVRYINGVVLCKLDLLRDTVLLNVSKKNENNEN